MARFFSLRVLVLLAIQILALLLNYGLNILLTNHLSLEDFGIFALIQNGLLLLAPISSLGLLYAALRFVGLETVASDTGQAQHFQRYSSQITFAVSLAFSLGLLLYWANNFLENLELILGFLILPLFALFELYTNILRAREQVFNAMLLHRLLRPLSLVAGLYLITDFIDWDIFSVLGLYALVHGLMLLIQWRLLASSRTATSPVVGQEQLWLATGLRLLAIQSIAFLVLRFPPISLGLFGGEETAALYTVLIRIISLTSIGTDTVGLLFSSLLAPLLSSQEFATLTKLVWQSIFYALLSLIILGLPLIYFSWFFFALFGIDYLQAANFLGLAFSIEIIRALRNPFTYALNLSGQERISLRLTMFILIIGLPLLLLASYFAAIQGTLLGILAIEILILLTFSFATHRYLGFSLFARTKTYVA